ncbi:MAG: hypothetical protein VKJ85_15620 [Prochlorothrix sp.]|nr:hypothetical protein [Prochlorothrix sp.]
MAIGPEARIPSRAIAGDGIAGHRVSGHGIGIDRGGSEVQRSIISGLQTSIALAVPTGALNTFNDRF